jgi:hypothetical protein
MQVSHLELLLDPCSQQCRQYSTLASANGAPIDIPFIIKPPVLTAGSPSTLLLKPTISKQQTLGSKDMHTRTRT